MNKKPRNEPYVQYVYHFQYPTNSIDVRRITKYEMEFLRRTYKLLLEYRKLGREPLANGIRAEQLLSDHFPEYLI